MDEIKDISKKEQESPFLDDKVIRTRAFGHNVSGDRAYQRAERLVAAIHLVTNHISPDEPARGISRRSGIHLLSSILMLRDEMRVSGSIALQRVQASIRKLISLMRILSIAGHVSHQNAEALVEALDELGVFLLTSRRTTLSESTVLTKDELLAAGSSSARGYLSDTESRKRSHQSIKDKVKRRDKMSDRADKTRMRGEGIVTILGAQGRLGIKDIAAHLPEYSEKMIQRELKGLVSLGRIKKVGSKRWSMYLLAQ